MDTNEIQAAVFERMRQAVGRLIRDGATLDGEIVLTVKDGQLVDVRLPDGDVKESMLIDPDRLPAERVYKTKKRTHD